MKNEKGGIKISTIIGVLLILIVLLFGLVVYMKYGKKKEEPNIGQDQNLVEEPKQPQPISTQSTEDFSLSFLKLENKKENMIYSPLSIKYALNMLQDGAVGDTYNQINKVIGNTSLTKYNNIEKVLSLANSVYIRDTYAEFVKESYKNTVSSKYNAELIIDKFENANNVNSWIENKTLGLIKNMLRDDEVQNPDLKMMLINALAIDMEWEEQFESKKTYGREFNLEDGTKMTATTLSKETSSDNLSYYVDDNITAVSMDLKEYEGNKLEFVAIMPKENLSKYVENVKETDIDKILNNMQSADKTKAGVVLTIPKFKFEYSLNFMQDLKDMGIENAFDSSLADFTNMYDLERSKNILYVNDAKHKATVDFSEDGIKAAAVTVFMMNKGIAIDDEAQPIEININNPFMFIIRDKKTGENWFTGTVYKPNSWENDEAKYSAQY